MLTGELELDGALAIKQHEQPRLRVGLRDAAAPGARRSGGFAVTLQRNPHVGAESVLLRLLELPASLFERQGTTSLIVLDEIQDEPAVTGADGKIRSVIQRQTPTRERACRRLIRRARTPPR